MSSSPPASSSPAAIDADWQWHILLRWQEFAAESRANLLRVVGIGVFYVVELLNYYGLRLGWLQWDAAVDRQFHLAVTGLVVAWVMVALAVQLCLGRRIFPPALKYITTAADLVLLTMILMVADGPKSPLIVGYFLVVVLAALRLQLRLVWCATAGAVAGYLVLLAYGRWYASPDRDIIVPRYQELMMILALGLTGIVLGQIVRRFRPLAEEFARRLRDAGGANA